MVFNRNRLATIAMLASSGILFSSSSIVEAAEVGATNSNADAGFIENTDITNPVDPTDPTRPIKPTKPPTPGPLSLNYVSDIQFGSHDSATEETNFYALLDKVTYEDGEGQQEERPNFVEVTDRRGANSGWRLTVRQNEQLKNENGTVLSDAHITMKNTTMKTLDDADFPPANVSKSEFILQDNQESLVVAAEKGTGMGSWSINFGSTNEEGKSSIALSVPNSGIKESGIYTTSLTWTLSDSI